MTEASQDVSDVAERVRALHVDSVATDARPASDAPVTPEPVPRDAADAPSAAHLAVATRHHGAVGASDGQADQQQQDLAQHGAPAPDATGCTARYPSAART